MQILKRDNLPEGGFAGLREHRLIKDPGCFGQGENCDGSWPGLGNFIYLADARYMPYGDTHMHSHRELDIISVMVEGRIQHEGSLAHGTNLSRNDVQIQRAGGEGFSHNEINPDGDWNRMIQIWLLPESAGQAARYTRYKPQPGGLTRVYGGEPGADFPAATRVDIGLLEDKQDIEIEGPFIAYLTRGIGVANGEVVEDGDLFKGVSLRFVATTQVQLIVVHTAAHADKLAGP